MQTERIGQTEIRGSRTPAIGRDEARKAEEAQEAHPVRFGPVRWARSELTALRRATRFALDKHGRLIVPLLLKTAAPLFPHRTTGAIGQKARQLLSARERRTLGVRMAAARKAPAADAPSRSGKSVRVHVESPGALPSLVDLIRRHGIAGEVELVVSWGVGQ